MSQSNTQEIVPGRGEITQAQILLGTLFAGSLVVASITAAKISYFSIPLIGGVAVPAGFVAIAVAFLCSDCMAEFYGKDYAHKVINASVLTLAVGYALIWVAIYLPVAPFYEGHEAYVQTLGASAGIMIASIITILISQHVDVRAFHAIRNRTGASHRWVRNLGSTSFSQLVDTVIFITLAFALIPMISTGDPVLGMALLSMIAGQYIVKIVVAVLDTPLFYIITSVRWYLHDKQESNVDPFTADA